MFHAHNLSPSLELLQSIRGFLFAFEIIYESVCCMCVLWKRSECFHKQDCNCSFVAQSCPTFGISCNSPGSKGFSEALLIGCNLLFKLERQHAFNLTVYKQLMQRTPMLLVTTGVSFPVVLSYLISCPCQRQIDSSCLAGSWCKQLFSSGVFWGRCTAGGFGLNLEVSMGMMVGFGDRTLFFLGTDEIIMYSVVEAEICTWKSFPFVLLASNVPPMTIPASHSLYANVLSQLPPQRVGQPSWREWDAQREIKWRRQSGAFLLCFVCVCLVYF